MLNLSDKELDRLSKEAAQEYDPGDVLGQGSWEKLEIRMDKDPGRLPANPLRHIRRFPFYYAPALLVLIGASYFFTRQGTKSSAGPPGSGKQTGTAVVKNNSSSKTPEISDKLNSTPATSSAAPASPAAGKNGSSVTPYDAGTGNPGHNSVNPASSNAGTGNSATPSGAPAGSPNAKTANSPRIAPGTSAVASSGNSGPSSIPGPSSAGYSGSAHVPAPGTAISHPGIHAGHQTHDRIQNSAYTRNRAGHPPGSIAGGSIAGAITGNATSGTPGSHLTAGFNPDAITGNSNGSSTSRLTPGNSTGGSAPGLTPGTRTGNTGSAPAAARELTRSTLGSRSRITPPPYIDDSALRHFTIKTGLPQITYKALHINRALEFGLLVAPDFASVNALAGDKAGSTIGATVDYQFADRWYIGSGLLLDRKNYAARAQDFQLSPNTPISQNIINHIEYVKGSFELLEIPLNLRYDFSVAGSTLFFASGGISSYLFTSENNGIYYSNLGRLSCDPQKSPAPNSYLFSSLHFSLGVETGLSNSFSLLIAPYAELPMRGIGMGQVQMSSVGINFSLRFAPVSSRKRY